jgi:hypothetical protein
MADLSVHDLRVLQAAAQGVTAELTRATELMVELEARMTALIDQVDHTTTALAAMAPRPRPETWFR